MSLNRSILQYFSLFFLVLIDFIEGRNVELIWLILLRNFDFFLDGLPKDRLFAKGSSFSLKLESIKRGKILSQFCMTRRRVFHLDSVFIVKLSPLNTLN